jgi:predicted acyl esterase
MPSYIYSRGVTVRVLNIRLLCSRTFRCLTTSHCPTANHVFLPGHRLIVQIQSSRLPLYDRNPQKFVLNVFLAKPEDYQKATQRIYCSSHFSSSLSLPVVSP